jgi:hypothetical protein
MLVSCNSVSYRVAGRDWPYLHACLQAGEVVTP